MRVNNDTYGGGCTEGKDVDEYDSGANTKSISAFFPDNDNVECDSVSFDATTCADDWGSVRHECGMVEIGRCKDDREDDTVDEYVSCVEDAVAVVFLDAVVLFA